jgi:hypothetical protein
VQQGAHGTQIGTHWKTWMCSRVPPAKLPLLGFTEVTITPPHRASSVTSSPRAGPIARTVPPHACRRGRCGRMPRSLISFVFDLSEGCLSTRLMTEIGREINNFPYLNIHFARHGPCFKKPIFKSFFFPKKKVNKVIHA